MYIVALLTATLLFGGCGSTEEEKMAQSAFEKAAEVVRKENEEAESVMEQAAAFIKEPKPLLDETLLAKLETAESDLRTHLQAVPEIPKKLEDLEAETKKLEAYSVMDLTTALKSGKECHTVRFGG